MNPRTVRIRRYPDSGHAFAEWGSVPRCVGNVSEQRAKGGYEWSSLMAEGVVFVTGGAGFAEAVRRMVSALDAEGFVVNPDAPPRAQAIACPACLEGGYRECASCGGTCRVWPEGGVSQIVSR